ncbi:MAG TPA: protein phosphatase 2C domain-containing protein [Paludibacteraceae bacterium]|nr:protein phosphatase 2C domain-containing protein [Paludibacteraceae bacterium]
MIHMIDNAYIQGYSHIQEGSPREDFGETKVTESCRIFAVADGHGDSNCPRSNFGSEAACHVAIKALESFANSITENAMEPILLGTEADRRKVIKPLIANIVSEWRKVVNAHFTENPLTLDERAKCDRYLDRYDRGEKLEHIYGTTLIAGLLTDKYLLLLQQGDGRCDVFDANGEVSQPIPWDDKCFANVTTSLCEDDAAERCRFCVIDVEKEPVIACIADSDGVEDSFGSMELLHCYHRDLLIYACEKGLPALHAHLKDTLPEMSENFSRDDITICGFIDMDKVQVHIPKFKRANERVRIESRFADVDSRLKSFDSMGKLAGLKAQYEKACAEVIRIENELKETSEELTSLVIQLQKARDDKEKREQAYKEYQGKKDSLLREREEIHAELSRFDPENPTEYIETIVSPDDTSEKHEEGVNVVSTVTEETSILNSVARPPLDSSVVVDAGTKAPTNEDIAKDLYEKSEEISEVTNRPVSNQTDFVPKHIGEGLEKFELPDRFPTESPDVPEPVMKKVVKKNWFSDLIGKKGNQ